MTLEHIEVSTYLDLVIRDSFNKNSKRATPQTPYPHDMTPSD